MAESAQVAMVIVDLMLSRAIYAPNFGPSRRAIRTNLAEKSFPILSGVSTK